MSSKIKSGLQNFAPRSKAKEVAPLCARRLSARRQRRLSAQKPPPPRSILIKEIYLFGGSGGGHAALLATAYKPELWNTVISYVPIVDIRKWHAECKSRGLEFYKDIEACIGECTPDNYLYEERSPITYLDKISQVNRLKIYAGKFDNIVDISQSLTFYYEIQQKYPSANIFLEVFEGGHFVNYDAIIAYFNDKGLSGMLDLSQ